MPFGPTFANSASLLGPADPDAQMRLLLKRRIAEAIQGEQPTVDALVPTHGLGDQVRLKNLAAPATLSLPSADALGEFESQATDRARVRKYGDSDPMSEAGMEPLPRGPSPAINQSRKGKAMLAQTSAGLKDDRKRAAASELRAKLMGEFPNSRQSGFDVAYNDDGSVADATATGVGGGAARDRADEVLRGYAGAAPARQNVDSIWALGGRKYPTADPEGVRGQLAQIVAGAQGPDPERLAMAKQNLRTRMAHRESNPWDYVSDRIKGEDAAQKLVDRQRDMKAKIASNRDQRRLENAPGLIAQGGDRARLGYAIQDRLAAGPTDASNDYVKAAQLAARRAMLDGATPDQANRLFQAAIDQGKSAAERKFTEQATKEGRNFTAGENEKNRKSHEQIALMESEWRKLAASRNLDMTSNAGVMAFKAWSDAMAAGTPITIDDAIAAGAKFAGASRGLSGAAPAGGQPMGQPTDLPLPGLPKTEFQDSAIGNAVSAAKSPFQSGGFVRSGVNAINSMYPKNQWDARMALAMQQNATPLLALGIPGMGGEDVYNNGLVGAAAMSDKFNPWNYLFRRDTAPNTPGAGF